MDCNRRFSDNGIDLDMSILDFLKWGCGNLWDGSDKGTLSEFIVKSAIGSDAEPEDGHDMMLLTEAGVSVVTSAASFLQSHDEEHLDRISFSCLPRKNRHQHPDVFVFCLFKSYGDRDPIDMANWTFYVLDSHSVRSIGTKTLTFPRLLSMGPCQSDFNGLSTAIEQVAG